VVVVVVHVPFDEDELIDADEPLPLFELELALPEHWLVVVVVPVLGVAQTMPGTFWPGVIVVPPVVAPTGIGLIVNSELSARNCADAAPEIATTATAIAIFVTSFIHFL
jgi:hypothetical protein